MAVVEAWIALAGTAGGGILGAAASYATTRYTLGKNRREDNAEERESIKALIALKDETIKTLQAQRDEAYSRIADLTKRVAHLEDRLDETESKRQATIYDFANAGTCLLAPSCPNRMIEGNPT